jgi:hypothetical protein
MGRVPIVFSLQEQTEGSRGIFPKQFVEELNIQQIRYMTVSFCFPYNYNHVTKNTSLKKLANSLFKM